MRIMPALHEFVPLAAEQPLRVAFLYMKGRVARLADVECGAAPTEFFYGSIEMARSGCDVAHYEIDPSRRSGIAQRLIGRLWPASARPVKMEPAILTQVWRLAPTLNQADCLVATGGNIAFALAALRCVGVIRKPIVGIQCGVLNFQHSSWRRRVSRGLLRQMHTQLFGEAELEPMRQFFKLPSKVISVNSFGVDTSFWRPGPAASREIVLAVGNDARRDFGTLVAAANEIPAPIHIVTKLQLPDSLPPNVTHHRGSWHGAELSDQRIRKLYQRAAMVVVPLHPSHQPSGQSVTLQAMACACPVILTRTEGLWSRAQMVDGENVLLVPPGDSTALAAAANRLLGDPGLSARLGEAGRKLVAEDANIERFAGRMAACCAASVKRAAWNP